MLGFSFTSILFLPSASSSLTTDFIVGSSVNKSSLHSPCTLLMFLVSNTCAAVIGIVFWKNERSSDTIARFTGGKKRRDIFYFDGIAATEDYCQRVHITESLVELEIPTDIMALCRVGLGWEVDETSR